jgi:hypothetical protein
MWAKETLKPKNQVTAPPPATWVLGFGITAISDQTNYSRIFERVALQPFQKFYWLEFEREALYLGNLLK